MKRSASPRAAALAVLIAFAVSFALPTYQAINSHHQRGWSAAWSALGAVGSSDLTLGERLNWATLVLANLVTPVLLGMLCLQRFRQGIPVWALILMALCAASSSQLVFSQLLVGYWVWWACQLATVGIGFWSRARAVPAPTASLGYG